MSRSFPRASRLALALGSALVALCSIAPSYAAGLTESVSKAGVAGVVPSGGTGAQTIDWTIDYDLSSASPLANVLLTDTWSAGQTLVPGSVHGPGGTWAYSQPDATSIHFTNPLVAPGGRGAGIALPIPLTGPVTFNGAGDGFNPAITASGKILGINHHIFNAGIWCYDMQTGASCPGYKMFPGINTTNNPFVRAIGNKIYIAGADNAGGNTVPGSVYCWDTDTDSLCGNSPSLGAYDRLEVADNGLIYTLMSTGEVDCFDPDNSLARCAGYPVQINVPAYGGNVGNGLLPVGNRLYALNYVGDVNCLDLTTLGFCAGWSSTPLDGPSAYDVLFPRLNAGGTVTGICQIGAGQPATCYDLDGTNPVTNNAISVVATGLYSYAADNDYAGSRVYFAGYGNNLACWDWATNAPCAGSGYDSDGRVTANLALPYGLTHDAGCLYTYGDGGALYSVDPISGETPCVRSTGTAIVDIDAFYGGTAPGSVAATWNQISLADIDLTAGVEFDSLVVTVVDPSDSSVVAGPTEMIGGAGVIDLSSVSPSIRTLELRVLADPVGTAAWQDSISPKIWLSFDSTTPVQFTYTTTITCAGSGQNHTNTINTTLDAHSDQATVNDLCLTSHTVVFDANGGAGSMSNQVALGAQALTTNTFTRAGHTFAGWNTAADGSGTAYADVGTYGFSADVTLYAQWTVLPTPTVSATPTATVTPSPTATASPSTTPTATATAPPATTTPTVTVAIPTATATPASGCGNGTIDGAEECDDGDLVDGDGCDATCRSELVLGGAGPKDDCLAEWLTVPTPPRDEHGIPDGRLICTDDDPACDFGATAGDGACTFHVALCLNVTEMRRRNPRNGAPACAAIGVRTVGVDPPWPTSQSATDAQIRSALTDALAGIGGASSGACRGARAGTACTDDAQCDSAAGKGDGACRNVGVQFTPELVTPDVCTPTADIVVPLRANGHRSKVRLRVRTTAVDRDGKPGKRVRDKLQLICAPAP